jgi:cardiolipin synthase
MKKFLTIPNIISLVRIALIPLFVWAFLTGRDILALALVVLSGISDKLDGVIARKFNQISETGKWLDPLADKLTQVALAALMFYRFFISGDPLIRSFAWVFLLFIGKEVIMLLFALFMLITGKRPAAAEIWGKVATVVFYVVMSLLLLAGPEVGLLARYSPGLVLPRAVVQGLVFLSLAAAIVSFLCYIPDTYRKLIKGRK